MSTDEAGEAVVKCDGLILWGATQRDLVTSCTEIYSDAVIESATIFDLDKILESLCNRSDVSSDDLINCWNMLKDVRLALGAPGAFYKFEGVAEDQAYMTFFSTASGGGLLDMVESYPVDRDFEVAREVVSTGILMLLDACSK
ncbi:hypothetical protein ASD78_14030 [Lysobacter sp. Root667]|uniref:hypothetical protein n=1 Tax=Lysobacter sp. Root667 TaxID=1736581 RepID=UPI0006F7C31A|nr:hypothetical protein [Lysobacter sp. Root667]KRA74573.1 hypothetical protein ASD78_14030 [Lysobacter sp. Root667]